MKRKLKLGITSRELKMLEKLFTTEIQRALDDTNPTSLPPCYQSKAKIFDAMAAKGLVEMAEYKLGGQFPMTIRVGSHTVRTVKKADAEGITSSARR